MRPLPSARRYYTGDTLNPLVQLRHPNGARVHAEVTLEVELPGDGTGNILTTSGLRQSREVDGDALDGRTSTLTAIEGDHGGPIVSRTTRSFELFDDGEHSDGAIEPDGIFGNLLSDLTRVEGDYTFRAMAEFGDGCTATRETFWSAEVAVGIDPGPDARQHRRHWHTTRRQPKRARHRDAPRRVRQSPRPRTRRPVRGRSGSRKPAHRSNQRRRQWLLRTGRDLESRIGSTAGPHHHPARTPARQRLPALAPGTKTPAAPLAPLAPLAARSARPRAARPRRVATRPLKPSRR